MEVLSEEAVEEWSRDGSLSKNQDFKGVSVFSSESDRSAESMVLFVNVFVERTPVKSSVSPVVESVLEHKEKGNLSEHKRKRGEWDFISRHPEITTDGVEEVDEGEFAGKVGQKDVFGASPDLGTGDFLLLLQLPFVEVWDRVDDKPWDASTKVYDLMDQKREKTGSDDRVTNPNIVTSPRSLEPIEVVEVHCAVERVLSLCSVHRLQMRSQGWKVLVQRLHGGLTDRHDQRLLKECADSDKNVT